MADIIRGFIIGLIAGAVVGGLFWIPYSFTYEFFTFDLLIGGIILIGMSFGAIGGIIGGIYAALFERLPGKTAVVKGIIIGVSPFLIITIFNLIFGIIDVIAALIVQPITLSKELILSAQILIVLIFMKNIISIGYFFEILSGVLYGFLLGKLWESDFQKISKDSKEEVIEFGS